MIVNHLDDSVSKFHALFYWWLTELLMNLNPVWKQQKIATKIWHFSRLIPTCCATFMIDVRGLFSKTWHVLSMFSGIFMLTLDDTLPNMSSQILPVLPNFWIKKLIVDTSGPVVLSLNSVTNFESQLGCYSNNTFKQWIYALLRKAQGGQHFSFSKFPDFSLTFAENFPWLWSWHATLKYINRHSH